MAATSPVRLEQALAFGPADLRGRVTTAADLAQYAADLEIVYGRLPDRGRLDDGEQVSFADLAAAAAGRIGTGVDLVITATPVPDCQARVLPGCLLAERVGGRPLLFGVNDQGAASAFTAIRLAAGWIRSGEVGRAAVVVMEQPTRLPEPGCDLPRLAGAAVVVLGREGFHCLAEVSIRRTRPEAQVRRARFLEPWAGLARSLAERPGAPVEVLDRDAALGYQCRLRFTTAARPGATDPAASPSGARGQAAGDLVEAGRGTGSQRRLSPALGSSRTSHD